ncbi:hypothetical protein HYH03_015880 [Edaphochlamys debaryana]|uniref:Uncharacterized protein n=1 Tax=Edaphochlamys debaryana TaxID=47281 RepID=A0A836BS16_9CHLO|nr:hypothetical protein HYH03_015880 [Edaphochlamys debaryana]|eukprot:KAG2485394.1 hypothetical protein HYH03_015880 [Edaphochlamys debaryana]
MEAQQRAEALEEEVRQLRRQLAEAAERSRAAEQARVEAVEALTQRAETAEQALSAALERADALTLLATGTMKAFARWRPKRGRLEQPERRVASETRVGKVAVQPYFRRIKQRLQQRPVLGGSESSGTEQETPSDQDPAAQGPDEPTDPQPQPVDAAAAVANRSQPPVRQLPPPLAPQHPAGVRETPLLPRHQPIQPPTAHRAVGSAGMVSLPPPPGLLPRLPMAKAGGFAFPPLRVGPLLAAGGGPAAAVATSVRGVEAAARVFPQMHSMAAVAPGAGAWVKPGGARPAQGPAYTAPEPRGGEAGMVSGGAGAMATAPLSIPAQAPVGTIHLPSAGAGVGGGAGGRGGAGAPHFAPSGGALQGQARPALGRPFSAGAAAAGGSSGSGIERAAQPPARAVPSTQPLPSMGGRLGSQVALSKAAEGLGPSAPAPRPVAVGQNVAPVRPMVGGGAPGQEPIKREQQPGSEGAQPGLRHSRKQARPHRHRSPGADAAVHSPGSASRDRAESDGSDGEGRGPSAAKRVRRVEGAAEVGEEPEEGAEAGGEDEPGGASRDMRASGRDRGPVSAAEAAGGSANGAGSLGRSLAGAGGVAGPSGPAQLAAAAGAQPATAAPVPAAPRRAWPSPYDSDKERGRRLPSPILLPRPRADAPPGPGPMPVFSDTEPDAGDERPSPKLFRSHAAVLNSVLRLPVFDNTQSDAELAALRRGGPQFPCSSRVPHGRAPIVFYNDLGAVFNIRRYDAEALNKFRALSFEAKKNAAERVIFGRGGVGVVRRELSMPGNCSDWDVLVMVVVLARNRAENAQLAARRRARRLA